MSQFPDETLIHCENLISAQQLAARLSDEHQIVLDASMPPVGIDLAPVPMHCYIPGAQRFDIDQFSDSTSDLPHTLLSPSEFEEKVRALGINTQSHITVYDNTGVYSAARAWWNFKIMGFKHVHVLDGGLKSWIAAGFDTVTELQDNTVPGNFIADVQVKLLTDINQMLRAMDNSQCKIIDVRSRARFDCEVDEPRPGLKRGHIPGAINIPFTDFYEGEKFKSQEDLINLFVSLGCKADHRLIFTCGSGVTACIGLLAASQSGFGNLSLYDGAWAEWGAGDYPVVEALEPSI